MTPEEKINKIVKDVFGEEHFVIINEFYYRIYNIHGLIVYGEIKPDYKTFWQTAARDIVNTVVRVKLNSSVEYITQ